MKVNNPDIVIIGKKCIKIDITSQYMLIKVETKVKLKYNMLDNTIALMYKSKGFLCVNTCNKIVTS